MRLYELPPTIIPEYLLDGGYDICPNDYIPPQSRHEKLYNAMKKIHKDVDMVVEEPISLLRSTNNVIPTKIHSRKKH